MTLSDLTHPEFLRGLLEWRNVPGPTGRSPSVLLFGRQIRSLILVIPDQLLPLDLSDIPTRRDHAQERSRAHADITAVSLAPLSVGDHIRIQNHLTKLWDDTGWVMKKRGRLYLVRSSNTRLKWRNRRFIRPFYEEVVQDESQTPVDLPTTEPLKRKSPRNPSLLSDIRAKPPFHLGKGRGVCSNALHHSY
ncbi:hypothetical protein TCAL_16805 [Tigriopus californicus]|uniref:Uncharacterized protein n=1 Tax=Tigriopus californicus TaxID=6832 RepID=A0A553P9Y3_TIGCA|nr:hypothetical protein TCAL_16805 [Tigriopus californicus]